MSTTRTARPAITLSTDLRQAMMADHTEIATMFDDLVLAFRSGNRDEAAAMFRELERRLEDHLATEDELLLPSLRHADPAEAAALADEHRRIRARLLELGVGVDLHLTRATWVEQFVDLLRSHARREDELLYRWASEPAAHVDVGALMRRLSAI
jgi:hemerythrin